MGKDTPKLSKERWIAGLAAALLVLGGLLLFFRGAFDASNCDFNPDSVEYASGGRNLVDHGRCEIILAGHGFSSRYPPLFSTLVAAPAYLVFGREPGNPVYVVLTFALVGLLAAGSYLRLREREAGKAWYWPSAFCAGSRADRAPRRNKAACGTWPNSPCTVSYLCWASISSTSSPPTASSCQFWLSPLSRPAGPWAPGFPVGGSAWRFLSRYCS